MPRKSLFTDYRPTLSHGSPLFLFDGICAIVIEIVKGNVNDRSLAITNLAAG